MNAIFTSTVFSPRYLIPQFISPEICDRHIQHYPALQRKSDPLLTKSCFNRDMISAHSNFGNHFFDGRCIPHNSDCIQLIFRFSTQFMYPSSFFEPFSNY